MLGCYTDSSQQNDKKTNKNAEKAYVQLLGILVPPTDVVGYYTKNPHRLTKILSKLLINQQVLTYTD